MQDDEHVCHHEQPAAQGETVFIERPETERTQGYPSLCQNVENRGKIEQFRNYKTNALQETRASPDDGNNQ